MGEKYLSGRGRPNNQPDAKRLKELPLAMHAVKNDKNPKLQYLRGAIHDPLNPPKGTQYVYHEKVGDGDVQCRAWVDSGKVKGWFVKMKKPAERRWPQEGHRWPSNTDAANYTTPDF